MELFANCWGIQEVNHFLSALLLENNQITFGAVTASHHAVVHGVFETHISPEFMPPCSNHTFYFLPKKMTRTDIQNDLFANIRKRLTHTPPPPPHSLSFIFSFVDDNSNQSSIADSSPLKQETSTNTSPTPEPMATAQNDGGDAKSEQFPSKQPSSGQDNKTGWYTAAA